MSNSWVTKQWPSFSDDPDGLTSSTNRCVGIILVLRPPVNSSNSFGWNAWLNMLSCSSDYLLNYFGRERFWSRKAISLILKLMYAQWSDLTLICQWKNLYKTIDLSNYLTMDINISFAYVNFMGVRVHQMFCSQIIIKLSLFQFLKLLL